MQKIALLGFLMPLLLVASDQPTAQAQLALKGSAVLRGYSPVAAKDLKAYYHANDAEWLNIILGTELDPETLLVRVLIDPQDGKLPKYLSDRIRLIHRRTQELVAFPSWLPLEWFKDAKNGDVVTRKFFGGAVEITCGLQAGGKPFHVALAGLMGPKQWADAEIREMSHLTASRSQD